jgi:hypothetical protein
MTKHLLVLPVLVATSLMVNFAKNAQAQEGGEPSVLVEVQTAQINLVPTAIDYRYSSIEKLNAIALKVVSNVAYNVIVSGDDAGGLRNADVSIRNSGTANYVTLLGGVPRDLLSGNITSSNGDNYMLDLKLFIPHANSVTAYGVGNIYSNEITFTVTEVDN